MTLYVCLGAGGFLIVCFIVFLIFRAKSTAKKNLAKLDKFVKKNKELMKLEENEQDDGMGGISFQESEIQQADKKTEDIDISKFATPYENSPDSIFNEFSPNNRERRVGYQSKRNQNATQELDDFEVFRKLHSHSKYFVDESLAEQLHNLSPKMKAVVLGELLKKIEYKD